MKTSLALLLSSLVCSGCEFTPGLATQIVITTPTGRKAVATQRYTLQEIESGVATGPHARNSFDIQHPVYPSKDQLVSLRQQLEGGGEAWYFRGLDSGWAIVKDRKVLWLIVTSHEF